jgi:hypothetical protein
MNDCHIKPNQYIKNHIPYNNINSRTDKSTGNFNDKAYEKPNIRFIQDLKKKVGPIKYKKLIKNRANNGNKSKQKLKNKNSAIKNIDPGNPKNIKVFIRTIKNNLGHIKFKPLISVISLVLKRLATASTNRNEFVDSNA